MEKVTANLFFFINEVVRDKLSISHTGCNGARTSTQPSSTPSPTTFGADQCKPGSHLINLFTYTQVYVKLIGYEAEI